MSNSSSATRCLHLSSRQRLEVALLALWFFIITTTLWLLKPVRTSALLSHLGAEGLPALRLGSVLAVGVVVLGYSRIVSRLSRLQVTLGASAAFALLIFAMWSGMHLYGEELGRRPWFVWSLYCLVEAYATVMVTLFWTYTNDVVSRVEADRLYAPIGAGGILGGIAGGAATDSLVHSVGVVNMLLVCAAGTAVAGALAWTTEVVLRPAPRVLVRQAQPLSSEMLEGARRVVRSDYLLCMVGIVVAYESASALTDFVINVIFDRSFDTELELAQMYGRLGWVVSATALATQLIIVPVLLPAKRIALLVPPLIMAAVTLSLALMPVVTLAMVMAASDRGLNYSLQQVTRETLYVPLGDDERYKAKALIDIVVDRAAKAVASLILVLVMLLTGTSLLAALVLALAALLFWARCAHALGLAYERLVEASVVAVRADSRPDAVTTPPT